MANKLWTAAASNVLSPLKGHSGGHYLQRTPLARAEHKVVIVNKPWTDDKAAFTTLLVMKDEVDCRI
jgi:hypothetical protein